MKIFLKHKKRSLKNNKGFTIIELVVVFFIMASILAVVIPGYLEYSTKLDLENLALDVALTIREAQSYGAGSKVTLTGGFFDKPYGVHFDTSNTSRFIFFENTNTADNIYSGGDTIINTLIIKPGYFINKLCTQTGGAGYVCGATSIDIIYKRPNPDAIISRNVSGTIEAKTALRGLMTKANPMLALPKNKNFFCFSLKNLIRKR